MTLDLAGGRRLMLAGGSLGWFWVAAGAVAAVLLLWLYREERKLISRRAGLALLSLRGLAAFVLVAALFEPIAARVHSEVIRGRVLVAVDDSESMTTVDLGRDPAQLKALATSPGDRLDGSSRRDIARRLIDGPNATLGKLSLDHDARASAFARDSLPAGSMADLAEALRKPPRTGDPARGSTDWSTVLAEALKLPDDAPLLGVVMLTDGRQNGVGDPSPLVDRLAARGIPIYPVLVGSTRPPADAAVSSIRAPEVSSKGDVAVVSAVLKLDGFAPESTVDVTLTRPGVPAMVQTVRVPGDGSRPVATFRLPLDVAGAVPVTVSVEPALDDARPDNDRRTVVVRVADDKSRVLIVDGEARWEFQYLRNALARDSRVSVDAIVFHQPATAASSVSAYPSTWPIRLDSSAPDPIGKYDLIVLGDVDPTDLPADAWTRLDAYVAERGGTLVVAPGPRFWPSLTGGEAARALLPVLEPRPITPGEALDPAHPALPPGLAVEPRREALENPDAWPMLQIGDGPEASKLAWSDLARLPWLAAGRSKPSATALAVAGGREDDGAVIASQSYGLGKVLWVGTNATWRWRFRVGDEIHHRFWGQVVRWASTGMLAVGNRVVRHGPTRSRVGDGEPIRLQARIAEDVAEVPADLLIAARISLRDSQAEAVAIVPLRPVPGQPRVFEGESPPIPEGAYVVRLDAPELVALSKKLNAGPIPEASLEVIARDTSERVELAAALDPLERLAAATGGKVFRDFEAGQLPSLLKSRSKPVERVEEFPLWDHPGTLILFFAIMTCEWVLRKRAGLP